MSGDNTDPNTDPNTEPEHIRTLRTRAEQAAALEAANQTKDREIAFLQAGVNTGTLFGKNVMQMHGDKEITPEAIAETVAVVRGELGLPDAGAEATAKAPKPGEDGSPEAQVAAAAAALHGNHLPPGSEPPPVTKSLLDTALDTYQGARRSGLSEIEAQEMGIGEVIRAGANGVVGAAYDAEQFQADAVKFGHGKEYSGLPERSYEPNVHHTKEHATKR